ncbi:glycogenin-2 isoform X2 [Antechinus flavipes]|uniref:glycogenin-2 isoform X2 n=1 Tax=Antechinus flavipes TaxID=38775 RepID=UPI002235C70D|nr:glycogenin-2 isoform X2 [Antechinus flavipes]
MDADTLVLCNIDELFDREELSAAPDSGWPDCFNSGVFVFQPSLETHNLLMQHAVECGSFDGADQGLLNSFFSNWATSDIHKHLPFLYNLSSSTIYTYRPAFTKFGSDVKVVHFLGPSKPWHYKYNRQTGSVISESLTSDSQHHVSFLDLWWKIYDESIVPFFDKVQHVAEHESQEQTISCRATKFWKSSNSSQEHKQYLPVQEFSEQTLEITLPILIPEVTEKDVELAFSVTELSIQQKVKEPSAEEERRKWEEGRVDYMGKDAFARIQEKLDRFLQ